MMLKLQRYQFTVSYKKGKELYLADTMSRAAVHDPTLIDIQQAEVFRLELAEMNLKPSQVTTDTASEPKPAKTPPWQLCTKQ